MHLNTSTEGELMPKDPNSGQPIMGRGKVRSDLLTLRMLGDNVTLARYAWFDLLDSLIPGCELEVRVRAMLCE